MFSPLPNDLTVIALTATIVTPRHKRSVPTTLGSEIEAGGDRPGQALLHGGIPVGSRVGII